MRRRNEHSSTDETIRFHFTSRELPWQFERDLRWNQTC